MIVEIIISGSLSLQRAVIIPSTIAKGIPISIETEAKTKEFLTLGPSTSVSYTHLTLPTNREV